jgi:hypothetical protein
VSAVLTLPEPANATEGPVAVAFANAPEKEEAIAEVLAAQAEPRRWITYNELKRRLGLGSQPRSAGSAPSVPTNSRS